LDAGTSRFGQRIPLGVAPAAITASSGSLWVADPNGGEILRVDPAAGTVIDRIPVGGAPGALAAGGGSVWVATTQPEA
jgi:DNA-binding beta-propeller fold protein YncE